LEPTYLLDQNIVNFVGMSEIKEKTTISERDLSWLDLLQIYGVKKTSVSLIERVEESESKALEGCKEVIAYQGQNNQ
jgi:hypothetical protein